MTAPDVPPSADLPSTAREVVTALGAVVGCVLLAAPAGLLWAALTPRITVSTSAGSVRVADPTTSAFIATEGVFLAVIVVVGLLTGLAAALLAHRAPIGAALGLAAGGLLAAEVARRTGALMGRDDARAVLAAGRDAVFQLPPRVRSWPALVGWPVAALAAHAAVTWLRLAREPRSPADDS